MRGYQNAQEIRPGEFMESSAILSNTGRVDMTVRSWTTNLFWGFTGGAMALLYDPNGNVLANTPVYAQGVDGLLIPGLPSDRTMWYGPHYVDPGIMDQVAGIKIVHRHEPTPRLKEIAEGVELVGKAVTVVIATIILVV